MLEHCVVDVVYSQYCTPKYYICDVYLPFLLTFIEYISHGKLRINM